jgi:hypothetical protein
MAVEEGGDVVRVRTAEREAQYADARFEWSGAVQLEARDATQPLDAVADKLTIMCGTASIPTASRYSMAARSPTASAMGGVPASSFHGASSQVERSSPTSRTHAAGSSGAFPEPLDRAAQHLERQRRA